MEAIYRSLNVPRFEIMVRMGSTRTRRFHSDAEFLRMMKGNSIEDVLTRYHCRFKSQYHTAVYIDENWRQYWLEKVNDAQPGQPDFTITIQRPKGSYPNELSWLR